MIDDRPTIDERYGAATEASDLRLREGRCHADLLIAAGLTDEIGMLLFRLVREYQQIDQSMKVKQVAADKATHRVLVLMDMRTLYQTKFAVLDLAYEVVLRRGFKIPDATIRAIVGRCIEAFLDNVCDPCAGTGVTGLYGGPQPKCRACRGSGERSTAIGVGDHEQAFAQRLLGEMEQAIWDARDQLSRHIRTVDERKRWLDDQLSTNRLHVE